jgi:aspartate racemase
LKTIGMMGGTSWESTLEYYRIINEAVRLKKKGSHSAKILLYSVDFATIRSLSDNDDWDSIAEMLITIGKKTGECRSRSSAALCQYAA